MSKAKSVSVGRVTTSIKVDPAIWKEIKIYCLKNDVEVSEFVEKQLKEAIKSK